MEPSYHNKDKKQRKPKVVTAYRENEETLTEKQREKLEQRGINSAMWHLERDPKTSAEIRGKLVKKDIPDSIIDKVIERLENSHMLDDRAYAEMFISSRLRNRKQSASVIKYELMRKGIDRELVDEFIEQIDQEEQEANAHELVKQKISSTRSLEPQKRTQRLVGMLARKGYPSSLAYRVVREEIDGLDPDYFEDTP